MREAHNLFMWEEAICEETSNWVAVVYVGAHRMRSGNE